MGTKLSYILCFLLIYSACFSTINIQGEINILDSFPEEKSTGTTLTIVTRHDITITDEFSSRFLATSEAIALNITEIEFYQSSTDDGWQLLLEDPSKSIDIAWGGGKLLFDKMRKLGLLYEIDPINNSDLFTVINNTVPNVLGGYQTKELTTNGSIVWAADSFSIMGFIVNHDFLETYGLTVPTTWEELATPTYYLGNNTKQIPRQVHR